MEARERFGGEVIDRDDVAPGDLIVFNIGRKDALAVALDDKESVFIVHCIASDNNNWKPGAAKLSRLVAQGEGVRRLNGKVELVTVAGAGQHQLSPASIPGSQGVLLTTLRSGGLAIQYSEDPYDDPQIVSLKDGGRVGRRDTIGPARPFALYLVEGDHEQLVFDNRPAPA